MQYPDRKSARRIETRACQLSSPEARLRFLQGQMAPFARGEAPRGGPRLPARWRLALLAGVSFLVLAGGGPLANRLTGGAGTPALAAALGRPAVVSTAPPPPHRLSSVASRGAPEVWLVEKTSGWETYSNGLRVETGWETRTEPRAYRALARATLEIGAVRRDPAGIVYHATESRMAPFAAAHNEALKRNGLGTLEYARRRQLYHYLIDRFGRVYRVVAETDYANHAGRSVWADERWVYVNLNQSYFGVSFEAQTNGGWEPYSASPAQIHAARVLTEMLRARYRLPAANCVVHAQVSVNPRNMYVGYHTDWAGNFPFRELGLPDPYEAQLAAITLFGFAYDGRFLEAIRGSVWGGLVRSEEVLLREAAARQLTPAAYRAQLQRKYREVTLRLKKHTVFREIADNES